jgi:NAD(P)-dependent dehydrogenase (short-subunit alcohol dehydrogenase family)
MPASGQFAGKVAFVTGAASGIGEATARAFAAEGAAVMIADIQVEQGRAVAEALKAAGTAAAFVECDVRSEAAIEAAVSETVRQFGRLDCAYNNAGIGSTHRLLADMPNEEWTR